MLLVPIVFAQSLPRSPATRSAPHSFALLHRPRSPPAPHAYATALLTRPSSPTPHPPLTRSHLKPHDWHREEAIVIFEKCCAEKSAPPLLLAPGCTATRSTGAHPSHPSHAPADFVVQEHAAVPAPARDAGISLTPNLSNPFAPADASLEMLIQLRLRGGKDSAAAVVAVPVPTRRARDEAKKNTNNKDKAAVQISDSGNGNLDLHYAALGVPVGAAAAVVKKAYSALARQHHPDIHNHFIHTGGNAAAAKKYHAVAEAYEAIMAKGPTTTRTTAQDTGDQEVNEQLKESNAAKFAPDLIDGHKSLMRGYHSIDPSNLPGEENPLRAALLRGVVVENHPDAATPSTRRRLLQGGHPLHDAPEDRKAATNACTAACCADVTCSAWQWCKAASKCDGETAKAPSTKHQTDEKAAALRGATAKTLAEMENKFENAQVKMKEHTHQAQGKA